MPIQQALFGFGVIHIPDEADRRLVPGGDGIRVDRRPVRRRKRR